MLSPPTYTNWLKHLLTLHVAHAFIQSDLQLIRLSRRQRHTPWSNVGLRALLKGPTAVRILSWPHQGSNHRPCGSKSSSLTTMLQYFHYTHGFRLWWACLNRMETTELSLSTVPIAVPKLYICPECHSGVMRISCYSNVFSSRPNLANSQLALGFRGPSTRMPFLAPSLQT